MRFRYLGDKDDMTAFGYDFSDGNCPQVTDPNAIAKLSANSHFVAVPPEMFVPTLGTVIRNKPGRKPKAQP